MMRISFPLTRFVFLCGVLWGLSTQAQTKDPAAILQLDTTTQGLLPPRMTTAQRDAIDSPPDGLMIYNNTTGNIEVYNSQNSWISLTGTTNPEVVYNGLVYFEMTTVGTGEIWLDRNIGATKTPKSVDDVGAAFGGTFYTPADSQAAGVCPPGYRLPTKAELEAERATFAANGGNNFTGAFNVLKLTRVGNRSGGTGRNANSNVGDFGFYYSSGSNDESSHLYFGTSLTPRFTALNSVVGFSVRCIKDD